MTIMREYAKFFFLINKHRLLRENRVLGNYYREGLLFTTRCSLKPSLSCFYLSTIHAEEENKALYLAYIYVGCVGLFVNLEYGEREGVLGIDQVCVRWIVWDCAQRL